MHPHDDDRRLPTDRGLSHGGDSGVTLGRRRPAANLPEVLDDRFLHAALDGEVGLLQGFAGGEPRGLDPALTAVAIAGGDLGAEQDLGEALITPLLLAAPVRDRWQRSRGPRLHAHRRRRGKRRVTHRPARRWRRIKT